MNLKQYMKNHSLRKLAERCGVSESTIRRVRDGERSATLVLAYQIHEASYGKIGIHDLLNSKELDDIENTRQRMLRVGKVTEVVVKDLGEDLL